VLVEVRLTNRFQKSYGRLDRVTQNRVRAAVGMLRADPRRGKPLKGDLAGEWSLRVGNHRVLYTIDGHVVWVQTVRHRREVYR
jgi:mRNA-degrading endonuclease RelE of RelBE toxin-antitoxin system